MEDIPMQVIDSRSQANATWMEHQILNHVKDALRVTLRWQTPAEGIHRKLSSVQFTLKSFQRHLERVMNLEEQGGYLSMVLEAKPNMQNRLERLEREHDELREEISHLVPEIESLNDYDLERINQVCDEIAAYLCKVDRHDQEEINLLQETLLYDEGGEG